MRVVGIPSESINGVSTVNFGANEIGSVSSVASFSSTSGNDAGSESEDSEVTLEGVEFYFCRAGNVWNSSLSYGEDIDAADGCSLCVDLIQEAEEVTASPITHSSVYLSLPESLAGAPARSLTASFWCRSL